MAFARGTSALRDGILLAIDGVTLKPYTLLGHAAREALKSQDRRIMAAMLQQHTVLSAPIGSGRSTLASVVQARDTLTSTQTFV